jgi:hypothetical protein
VDRSLAGRSTGDDDHSPSIGAGGDELGKRGCDGGPVALAHDQGNPRNIRPGQQGSERMRKKGTARQSHKGFACQPSQSIAVTGGDEHRRYLL